MDEHTLPANITKIGRKIPTKGKTLFKGKIEEC
jgi:hypothetical protein